MVSYSQLKAFRECRQLWYYKYHLRVEPKITPVRLALGTAIHAGIEAYYADPAVSQKTCVDPVAIQEGYDYPAAFQTVFCASFLGTFTGEHPDQEIWQDEEWNAAYTLGLSVLFYYCAWAREHDTFKVLATELDLAADLIPGLEPYTGRLDGVARDQNGELWVLEYKTVDNFPPPGHLDFDVQSSSYQWLLQTAISNGLLPWADPDDEVAGVIYTGLRKVCPKAPDLLKSGKGLSQAQATSTYALWLDAIEQHGFAYDAYSDKLQALLAQPDPVVHREWHRRERCEVEQVAEELRQVYAERSSLNPFIYRTPTRWCTDRRYACPFAGPCLAALKGGDEAGILSLSYRPRSHRGAVASLTEEVL